MQMFKPKSCSNDDELSDFIKKQLSKRAKLVEQLKEEHKDKLCQNELKSPEFIKKMTDVFEAYVQQYLEFREGCQTKKNQQMVEMLDQRIIQDELPRATVALGSRVLN